MPATPPRRHRLDALIRPRSIAVIGASADANKTTGRPVAYLHNHGYTGTIYPVNPRYDSLNGLPCYPDVATLPQAPDVGLVLLGPDQAQDAVTALALRGTPTAIVLAGGYRETGALGAQRQEALLASLQPPLRLLGPNTIGLVNLTDRIMLSASATLALESLHAGTIGVVSQSGGIMGSLLSRAAGKGIGLSRLIATGNEADLDAADLIDYLIDDDATSVIALYLEAIRRPRHFMQVAQRALACGKPIVAYKVGRSEAGARSAQSHTGAIASEDRLVDALLRQCGIVRAQTFNELLDLPAALATGRRLRGRRIGILTTTGGAGTLVADACGLVGLQTPAPDATTGNKLAALLSDQSPVNSNPVDLTMAGVKREVFHGALNALLDSPVYDGVVVVVGSSGLTHPDLATGAIHEGLARSDKVVLTFTSPHVPGIIAALNRANAAAFDTPESCAAALRVLLVEEPAGIAAPASLATGASARAVSMPSPGAIAPPTVARWLARSGMLDEHEARQLFADCGVTPLRARRVATPAEAGHLAQSWPDGAPGRLAVKVIAASLVHKSEAGGVSLNVAPEDVAACCAAMAARVHERAGVVAAGFLIEPMVSGGLEMILGITRDPQLGPALLLGMGGLTAELLNDAAVRLLPVTDADVRAMLAELKTGALLHGYRNLPARDVDALVAAALSFAAMAQALGDHLLTAEINPLFVLPAGLGVAAGDGVVSLAHFSR